MELRIPGRVWYDALDPMATGMEADLELPQPHVQPKGRGVTFVYRDVTNTQANDLADYLEERAQVQSSYAGLDPNERELYRVMGSTARKMREAAKDAALRNASLDPAGRA